MMKRWIRALVVLPVLFMVGCATTHDTTYLEPLHTADLHSILIVPVNNNTIDVQAPTSVLATLPFVLAEKGYYVFPVHTVKTLLDAEGYYEAAEVHAAPSEALAALFGADSILYVTIHEWEARYAILATTTEVDFEYKLVSAAGETLWEARKGLMYSPQNQNSSGNIFADMIAMAITAAIERAAPNYLPLTRQANHEVFNGGITGLPPGPNHPEYQNYYRQIRATQGATAKEKSEE
ncbi:DUF799 domain-containing protein [Aliidiomarina indica]|uniref:DUF799 domain-containing protein n=1 Tax=Aliidiomarina indica TaxID=2749147 RepID=UPI001E4449E8|nr:GNA1162 family protein [Aliidiomarina indica]